MDKHSKVLLVLVGLGAFLIYKQSKGKMTKSNETAVESNNPIQPSLLSVNQTASRNEDTWESSTQPVTTTTMVPNSSQLAPTQGGNMSVVYNTQVINTHTQQGIDNRSNNALTTNTKQQATGYLGIEPGVGNRELQPTIQQENKLYPRRVQRRGSLVASMGIVPSTLGKRRQSIDTHNIKSTKRLLALPAPP